MQNRGLNKLDKLFQPFFSYIHACLSFYYALKTCIFLSNKIKYSKREKDQRYALRKV